MPMMVKEESVAANTRVASLFAGDAFEFARARAILSLAVAAAATGVFTTLQAGADVIAQEFSCPILTRYPIIPDEFYFTEAVEVGDRIIASMRNSTGAPIVCRAVAQLSA